MRSITLLLLFVLILCHITTVLGARSGPFKTTFIRVAPCPNPTQPVDSDPPSYFFAELYNTTSDIHLMRGNVTVVRDHRVKKMKAKGYLWDNNKWKINYLLNNMSCNRVFFRVFCMAAGLKFDRKTCNFFKGVYTYERFNLNKLQHMSLTIQEYGRILWRAEMSTQFGTVFCHEFETIVEKIK